MAVKVILFIPDGEAYGNLRGIAAEKLDVIETNMYSSPEEAAEKASDLAKQGKTCILFAGEDGFVNAKLILLKATGAKILRSSQIVERGGANLPVNPKDYNVQTAFPEGGKVYLSEDGLFSSVACKIGEGKVLIVPAEENRLTDAIHAGAFEDTRSARDKISDLMKAVEKTGKKVAVSPGAGATALMAVIKSVDRNSDLFVMSESEADIDPDAGSKAFAAESAKAALDETGRELGAYISMPSEDGDVTLAVACSESAKIEVLHSLEGEDK